MTDNFKSSAKATNTSLASLNPIVTSSNTNILVTLRRMKIEENYLAKDINKVSCYYEGEDYQSKDNNYLEYKKYSSDLKSHFTVIKDLYEDVKANTTSEDNLQLLDIDDVKKDVFGLENKIKTMKAYLQSELFSLKNKELDLVQDAHEKVSDCNRMCRRVRRAAAAAAKPKLSDMVSSPVKFLISSPFKCPEVQQFQKFMKSSTNRYGGWNAYHHNVFEQLWRKHFGTEVADDADDCHLQTWEEKQKKSDEYSLFLEELLRKIPGMSMKDFTEHQKWYTKYINLKNRQQKALHRWRENKNLIKKHRSNSAASSSGQVSKFSIDKMDQDVINSVDEIRGIEKVFFLYDTENSESSSLVNNSDGSKEKTSNISRTPKERRSRHVQHTAQSQRRSARRATVPAPAPASDTPETNFNIEQVQRLGVPAWRFHLRDLS